MKPLKRIVFFLPLFLACNDHAVEQNAPSKEFEGVITYRITYDNYPEEFSYGDTMKAWYSKGDLIKLYNGKAVNGMRKELFLLKGNKYYFQMGKYDSLFSYNIGSDKFMKLVDSRHSFPETRILGHTCEQIDQDLQLYTATNHAKEFATFLYSKDILPVEKDHFKDRKISCFDRFIDESGVFYLQFKGTSQFDGHTGLSSFIFTAIDIKEQPVDPSIFNVDTSLVNLIKM